jgi:O-acetylserine/cysteine efflux transporter
MTPGHMVLAAATSIVWGVGFAAGKIALESLSPAQLTAARFAIACLPVALVPRPRIGWGRLVAVGATLFTGQFLFMFFAFAHGLPPGVASISQQMQAFLDGRGGAVRAAVAVRGRALVRADLRRDPEPAPLRRHGVDPGRIWR